MIKQPESLYYRDFIKLGCLILVTLGTLGIFVITPGMQNPTLLSLILATLLAPWVERLRQRGLSKMASIGFLFALMTLVLGLIGFWAVRVGLVEWDSLKDTIPVYFKAAMTKLQLLETRFKTTYPILKNIQPTETLLHFGNDTARWFVDHGASLLGEILTWILLIPPFTFVLLNEGQNIRQGFLRLVPNRYFESFYLISSDITQAISDYLRAKLLEGLLVGVLIGFGLWLIGMPYPAVLGVLGGVTNIIPYLGPFLGAAPGLLITLFDDQHANKILAMLAVYLIANLLDSLFLFPIVVAKLVRLHPLILTAVVIVGQQYYGLIGMLISIPIASALKVVLQEVYFVVYERRPLQEAPGDSDLTSG